MRTPDYRQWNIESLQRCVDYEAGKDPSCPESVEFDVEDMMVAMGEHYGFLGPWLEWSDIHFQAALNSVAQGMFWFFNPPTFTR